LECPARENEKPEHGDLWPVCVALIIGAAFVGYLVGIGSAPRPPDLVIIRSAFDTRIADAKARGETVAELMLERLKAEVLRILG
jgi:hypothetical protein